ncbi:hypothetical protein BscR1v2_014010 [Bartonella schoenbuchensis R1]|uniref:Uncharacterized protein n=1 Tax=Bartonella schoenbuchensis (strain DSM 13525 / NCTC 13165 / R1) TaxID=687861 RepID=E6Z1C0_BARSR|nr:hypothetical protein BscR1v2_014010 [Bartonella schoenbuchensis R1]CBI82908.1 hypothetical protein BARSC_190181 [Bartonella schoenbuchensis R1]
MPPALSHSHFPPPQAPPRIIPLSNLPLKPKPPASPQHSPTLTATTPHKDSTLLSQHSLHPTVPPLLTLSTTPNPSSSTDPPLADPLLIQKPFLQPAPALSLSHINLPSNLPLKSKPPASPQHSFLHTGVTHPLYRAHPSSQLCPQLSPTPIIPRKHSKLLSQILSSPYSASFSHIVHHPQLLFIHKPSPRRSPSHPQTLPTTRPSTLPLDQPSQTKAPDSPQYSPHTDTTTPLLIHRSSLQPFPQHFPTRTTTASHKTHPFLPHPQLSLAPSSNTLPQYNEPNPHHPAFTAHHSPSHPQTLPTTRPSTLPLAHQSAFKPTSQIKAPSIPQHSPTLTATTPYKRSTLLPQTLPSP